MKTEAGGTANPAGPADRSEPARSAWAEALQAAALFAVDPCGIGGVWLRGAAGPAQQAWLATLQALLPADAPLRRVPLRIADERLLGGLDLSATLHAGRPVVQRGLLAEADGGVLVLAMAERVAGATAARLAQAMDTHAVALERDGVALRSPARWGLVALDEGREDDEGLPAALAERLGLVLDLGEVQASDLRQRVSPATSSSARPSAPSPMAMPSPMPVPSREAIAAARQRLPNVEVSDALLASLCTAAFELGVGSVRAPLMAVQVARASAALRGSAQVSDHDAAQAAALVLGPRATRWGAEARSQTAERQGEEQGAESSSPPAPPSDRAQAPESPPPADPTPPGEAGAETDPDAAAEPAAEPQPSRPTQPDDTVLAAAQAAIPAGLLARLQTGESARRKRSAPGRSGQAQHSLQRGRPCGTRRGEPRGGQRLSVIETLRAAAPWQRLRRAQLGLPDPPGSDAAPTRNSARIQVRREDFHVAHFKQRSVTTTVFVVDASGSSALHRLAEAKGAVELLLADCYVRRDRVAVIAFRGRGAELLLPPTRSLVRAKRSLAGLPGGGGTPLAAGIDMARLLAEGLARRGETPTLVLLTDGRANIARDGSPGRARATEDALAAARQSRLAGIATLLLDTAPHPQPQARELGAALGATYLPLPHAGAAEVSRAVRASLVASP